MKDNAFKPEEVPGLNGTTAKKGRAISTGAVKYPREALLTSKLLERYQPDFARAALTGPEYTVYEARALLDRYLNKRGVK